MILIAVGYKCLSKMLSNLNLMKRLFDILTSLVLLTLMSPLLVMVGIAISVESKGPIIFRQDRVGFNGKIFRINKFRSMFFTNNEPGSYYTEKNDPRITRVGRFIRDTSLDELPQLINVLTGDMSIVGPRPDLLIQKTEYAAADWDLRNTVRPGITGLAQISGRSNSTFENRLYHDIKYSKTHNFFLDLKIIVKTIQVVLLRNNLN